MNDETTATNSYDFVTILSSMDAFGDGASRIYFGDKSNGGLDSDESLIGYKAALEDLDVPYQEIDIDYEEDWTVTEGWGQDAPTESLQKLLESAYEANLDVRIIGYGHPLNIWTPECGSAPAKINIPEKA